MGQAWCKAKAAQDSKSPFDRVLVRCAHRIYPGLKEECSVLGGATQRVTSSEIGYARGCSIDSTDKPFHPSEWVDVNLEVSNAILYPYPKLTKNVTPIPPPRKRKKITSRPLPPKPDDVIENHNHCPLKSLSKNAEPLYSSVKTSNLTSSCLYPEHSEIDIKSFQNSDKVNGTKEIIPIPSDVVSEERSFIDNQNVRRRSKLEMEEEEEYERRFSSSQSIQNFSTINHFNKDVVHNLDVYKRSKNESTISLPNYNQLQVAGDRNDKNSENEKVKVSSERLLRKAIAGSLPLETFTSTPHSKVSNERFEDIVWQADFQDIQVNKLENNQDKSMNRTQSEDRDFDENNEQVVDTNISSNSDSLDFSDTLKDSLISQDIKASTPIKTVDDAKMCLSKELKSSSLLDSTAGSHEEKNEKMGDDTRNCFSSDTSNLFSQVFYEVKAILPDKCSQEKESNSDIESCEKKESRIHRTISQESLPREMLEAVDSDLDKADDDQEDDFEKKLAKDVQNRITKNVVGTKESDREILSTPPSTPEPKIKADVLENDHSTLLKVLQEEAASSPPSLLELEIALSDMLEKEEDHDDSLEIREDDSTYMETKPIENLIEPCIVPLEKERTFTDKKSDIAIQEDEKKCQNPESNNSAKDKVKIVAVELKNTDNGRPFEKKKQVLHDLSENSGNSYNILSYSKEFQTEKIRGEEAPEKPSRMHRINFANFVENVDNVPTPPRRRHRSGSSILKENVCRAKNNRYSQNEESYVNDRLI
ncbi:myb-like protein X isoform X2 [Leptopilina heterotoma]|uniref:myb-like protein X isoform X2 n=1 Tax=Leptopilina heterotoma TaxID=63436 RepID=UPI001CA9734C|nr:myb-like protein X isoform X2 [Leptopilina heterotoma]